MTRGFRLGALTLPDSAYGLARVAARFSLIVARTGRGGGQAPEPLTRAQFRERFNGRF